MGLVIMAIKDGNDWYVDGRRRKSIRARNGEMRNIRPGYIIMKASEDLDFGGRKTRLHETLLEDFLAVLRMIWPQKGYSSVALAFPIRH